MHRRSLLALAAACHFPARAQARVTEVLETWHDAARDRALPVRLRLPTVPGPAPAVLVSHGLGGSRDGLAYLGRALAEAGFVAVHLQHPGSDSALWRNAAEPGLALAAAAFDVSQAIARLQDCVFAFDEVLRRNGAAGPLRGRVDAERLAAAGHSYGAWTVQHLLGQRLPGNAHALPVPDTRLGAGILLSPVPSRGLPPRLAFARMTAPLLHVTGTRDHGYIEGTTAADREIPFRAIEGVPQVLAVLDGAAHAAFADEAAAGSRWAEATYHARTAALSVAFLRAALLNDAAATALLGRGGAGLLASGDRLEVKGFTA